MIPVSKQISKQFTYNSHRNIYNLDNIATTIRPIILERTNRQFGIPLPDEEIVHQGIGGFMEINSESTFGLVRPTKLFKDELKFEVDGLTFILAHVPGETDDHLYVWLPDKNAVMVGDNFYRSFANLYAIRGTKFRNPMEWVQSLDKIRMLNAEYLIPSELTNWCIAVVLPVKVISPNCAQPPIFSGEPYLNLT